MSFVLFWFHVVILVAISPRIGCSSFVHDGFWTFKILFVVILYIGFFFLPHSVFQVWAQICRGGSTLFFIIQAYFLLNACYTVNDFFSNRASRGSEADQSYAHGYMLAVSIVFTLISGTWLGFQFYWAAGCTLNFLIVLLTTLFAVFFYAVALSKLCNVTVFRENATMMTCSLATLYMTYLSWTTISSNPHDECQPTR